MKKTFLLFTFLFAAICIYGQQNGDKKTVINETKLVKQIKELLVHSKNGFKKIMGSQDKELNKKFNDAKRIFYRTSLKPEGSVETYIEKEPGKLSYRSYFGKDIPAYSSYLGDTIFRELSTIIKDNFTGGYEITENFEVFSGDSYKTLRLQQEGEKVHYLELVHSNIDNTEEMIADVYIVVY